MMQIFFIERDIYFADIYFMNKLTTEIVGMIESYLKDASEEKPTPKEIEFHILNLLLEHGLVNELFSIEVISLNDSYMLRTRNQYTSLILGAMPSFCRICGKLVGKSPCQHEQ
jgi:hypothetical protein